MWEFLNRKKETAALPVEEPTSAATKEIIPAKKRELLEGGNEQVSERLSSLLSVVSTTSPVPDPAQVSTDAATVHAATDAASQVNQLVALAQTKGLAHAVAVARQMNDFYVLDTMHDELVDQFYEALRTKGLIEGEK